MLLICRDLQLMLKAWRCGVYYCVLLTFINKTKNSKSPSTLQTRTPTPLPLKLLQRVHSKFPLASLMIPAPLLHHRQQHIHHRHISTRILRFLPHHFQKHHTRGRVHQHHIHTQFTTTSAATTATSTTPASTSITSTTARSFSLSAGNYSRDDCVTERSREGIQIPCSAWRCRRGRKGRGEREGECCKGVWRTLNTEEIFCTCVSPCGRIFCFRSSFT